MQEKENGKGFKPSQLQALFRSQNFSSTQFADGIWSMTLRAEWDFPPISLWHWLRFIDAYLGVRSTGIVPELILPEVLKKESEKPCLVISPN